MDSCFQCKLCEVQCPYTQRDQHEFKLDFPKLVHRYRAVTRKGARRTLQRRVLNDPDTAGRMARAKPSWQTDARRFVCSFVSRAFVAITAKVVLWT